VEENILNLYIIIENDIITEIKAKSYSISGSDEEKIDFLKSKAGEDYNTAQIYQAPISKKDKLMTYKQFSKLEKQGIQFQLFEHIFVEHNLPKIPLVCLTPVVNGQIKI
jgi:hypothetical protein